MKLVLMAIPLLKKSNKFKKKEKLLGYFLLSKNEKLDIEDNETALGKLKKAKMKAFDIYHEYQGLHEKDWRKKMVDVFDTALALIDPLELLAADISYSLKHKIDHDDNTDHGVNIEVIYPNSLGSGNKFKSIFMNSIESKSKLNSYYLMIYTAMTPITSFMAILPGPNVFFAMNAARLYSLYRARLTFEYIKTMYKKNKINYIASDSKDLNWIINDDDETSINDQQITNIATNYNISEIEWISYLHNYKD